MVAKRAGIRREFPLLMLLTAPPPAGVGHFCQLSDPEMWLAKTRQEVAIIAEKHRSSRKRMRSRSGPYSTIFPPRRSAGYRFQR
jgi:hypothetical protein